MRSERTCHVVWVPGPADWQLGPVYPSRTHFGGHRTLHELAVAIAATGRQVELRGDVDLEELERLATAAGAWPELPRDARRPRGNDIVVMPEGNSAATFAQVALSRARVIILLLAPPGMCGWPFCDGWSYKPPTDVNISSLATAEQFRGMAALGFELWTHMPEVVRRAHDAGVPCAFVGTGRPLPYPEPLPKGYDVVTLTNNRWAELAREVASRLDPAIVWHEIPAVSNEELLRQLGQARVFVHPIRVEGSSRLGVEARAMGAVPVVLNSSPFSVGLDEAGGAVPVSSLDEMPTAVARLLKDPARLNDLRVRGRQTARAQIDWDAYVARIDAALSAPPPVLPGRGAQAVMGDALLERENAITDALREEVAVWRTQAEMLSAERVATNGNRETLAAALESMQGTRAWRAARRYWRTRDRIRRMVAPARAKNGG